MLLAFYFGTQAKVDIYFYCFTTISLLSAYITLLNATIIIPESIRIRKQIGEGESKKFINIFIYGYIGIGLLLSLILFLFPTKAFLAISKFDISILNDHKNLLLLSVPLFSLMILEYLLADVLASYKYFTVPQLAKMINSILALLFLSLFHGTLDIKSIFIGLITGYSLNIILLIRIMYKNLKWNFRFKAYRIESRILINSLYSQLSNLAATLNQFLPLYFLSGLGSGVVSALNYGQRTSNLPTNSITQQFAPVVAIKFNELHSTKNYEELNKVFFNTSGILLFLMMPISGLFFVFGEEIIKLLFQRGSFDMAATMLSSQFLSLLGLSIPLIAINNIVTRLFMAGHKLRTYFYYQTIKSFIFITAVYFAINKFGALAFPITWFVVQVINVISYKFIISLEFKFINYTSVLIQLFKYSILNIAISALIAFLKNQMSTQNYILQMLIGGFIYIVLVLAINYVLKLNSEINKYVRKYINYLPFINTTK